MTCDMAQPITERQCQVGPGSGEVPLFVSFVALVTNNSIILYTSFYKVKFQGK